MTSVDKVSFSQANVGNPDGPTEAISGREAGLELGTDVLTLFRLRCSNDGSVVDEADGRREGSIERFFPHPNMDNIPPVSCSLDSANFVR